MQEKRKVREDAKRARAEVREEKKQRKNVDKVMKAAAKEGQKENRPKERLKRMVVILNDTLLHNSDFMDAFILAMGAAEMTFRTSDSEPGFVRWKRVTTERSLDGDSQEVVEDISEVDEDELLVILQAQGFVGLVHHSKQVTGFQRLVFLWELFGGFSRFAGERFFAHQRVSIACSGSLWVFHCVSLHSAVILC
jgi:hypothetical protein